MSLKEELGFLQGFSTLEHEGLLNIYYTATCIKKRAALFFRDFDITDVQFNLLEILFYHSGKKGGLTQVELSRMLLVNRANITSLIDRMEKAGLVIRTDVPGDRRCHIVKLTGKGRKRIDEIEDSYIAEVKKLMRVLKTKELKTLIRSLEKIREKLHEKDL